MLRLRRWTNVLGITLAGLALAAVLTNMVSGQFRVKQQLPFQPQPGPGNGTASGFSGVRIVESSEWRRVINVGRDCIKDKEWKQAIQALQAVLNETKDHYVKITETDPSGKVDQARWTSVKFEANNLIGSMAPDGLEAYELAYGKEAKDLVDDAKAKGDRDALEKAAQRFCHTKAGIEANEIVATLYLARGEVFTAALRFEKLLAMNSERAKLSDLTLFKAALAFRRAGDTRNYEDTWKRLETNLQAKTGLKVGDNTIPLAKLQDVLNETAVIDVVNLHDWPMVRGNKTNTAQANGSPPLLDLKLWQRPIFLDKTEGINDQDNERDAQDRVRKAIEITRKAGQPVLSGFFPIAAQSRLVYRSHHDIRAVALKDLEIREGNEVYSYKAGQIIWKSIPMDRSLSVLLDTAKTRGKTEQWIDAYSLIPGYASFLYDNSLLGTLSTDHRYVYAINDLAVPPVPSVFQPVGWNQPQFQAGTDMDPLLKSNTLQAYNLENGRLVWELNASMKEFEDSHFLGQPITVGGKLYVLNEKVLNSNSSGGNPNFFPGGGGASQYGSDSELRLICLDPTKFDAKEKPSLAGPIQVLGNISQNDRFIQDPRRRVNAVHLGFGEGILVCPTNAGEVFGIDLMTRSLIWSYPYRESAHLPLVLPNQPNMGGGFRPDFQPMLPNLGAAPTLARWKAAPPALQDGKVVFTAPDADSIHCISLRDGKPAWKRPISEGDQYMAGVYQGRVLVVNKTHLRALNLKDGSHLWTIYTGQMPSGQGVASKGIYYLPLEKGEILAVNIERGTVKAHNRAAIQGFSPGNLVFYEGAVLSQTPTEMVAYPQLVARLAIAKTDSANDPENLAKLTDYGELLLKDGQVQLAVETLLKVFNKNTPNPLGQRVKDRLFEALTDLMQVDFAKASKDYLTVYQSLCAVPGNTQEEQVRKAKFFRLMGQGREGEGNLVEAFQMYKDFGALPIHREQGGIASLEDPSSKTPVNVWLRGRIAGMFAKATPEQREPLEAKIADEWRDVEAKKDLNQIRSFVGMFDVPFQVGRQARIRLAETIMEKNERPAFLEAELYLYQVMGTEFRTDPNTGGRALAALAQLEEKKGTIDSMRLAANYYRELGRDFAGAPVRGAKTGSDLLNELAADKRFLPFLQAPSHAWGAGKLASRQLPRSDEGAAISFRAGFVMRPAGEQTPFAQQHRLVLDPSNSLNAHVRLRDVATGQDRWDASLGAVQMNQNIFTNLYQQSNVLQGYHPDARFRFYHVKGHLIVCQVGVMVYCLDGDTGKKLWEMQTVENFNNGMVHLQGVQNDREGNPEFTYWNQMTNQRFRLTLGRIGTVQPSYVAVLGHKGLNVVDPLRGTPLWTKHDLSLSSHVFGDDQYLFLVEATESGGLGAGRTLRASDGEVVKVPDFGNVYQGRLHVEGRHILAAHSELGKYTLRRYDIIAGKDVWTRAFPPGSFALHTEDPHLSAVVDPLGKLTVVDARDGKELLESSVVQGRITLQDLKGLYHPLLLADGERFYVALNRPLDASKVGNGHLHNNFSNGTRCMSANGWFLALQRQDGARKAGNEVKTWKKGDLAWHSYEPMQNQLIVLEEFEQMPVVLFSARYNEILSGGGNRWVSVTQSLHKVNGKMVSDSGPQPINTAPMFATLQVDQKARSVNLIGLSGSIQIYLDDGKGPPPLPQTALLERNFMVQPVTGLGVRNFGMPPIPAVVFPPNGRRILLPNVPQLKR